MQLSFAELAPGDKFTAYGNQYVVIYSGDFYAQQTELSVPFANAVNIRSGLLCHFIPKAKVTPIDRFQE